MNTVFIGSRSRSACWPSGRALAITAALAALAPSITPARAQEDRPVAACPSQQDLEKVVGSSGKLIPEACRQLSITRVQSDGTTQCVLEFSAGKNPGVLDRLADAAVPMRWWVLCDQLGLR